MPIEPKLRPDKWELCRVIREWVIEHCGIPHATLPNLDRLNQGDLELIYLALGFKLDIRDIANIERFHQVQWEYAGRHRTVDGVADQKAIGHDGEP
jgi:hypothetical protein